MAKTLAVLGSSTEQLKAAGETSKLKINGDPWVIKLIVNQAAVVNRVVAKAYHQIVSVIQLQQILPQRPTIRIRCLEQRRDPAAWRVGAEDFFW